MFSRIVFDDEKVVQVTSTYVCIGIIRIINCTNTPYALVFHLISSHVVLHYSCSCAPILLRQQAQQEKLSNTEYYMRSKNKLQIATLCLLANYSKASLAGLVK